MVGTRKCTLKGLLLVLYFSMLTSLLSPSLAPRAQTKEEAALRLDWFVFGLHVPFYVAQHKGFYDQENIIIKILEGKGSNVTVQTVGAGSDDFGFADYGVMAIAIAKGVPVKGIGAIIQKSEAGIVFLKDSGIKRPEDLVGKKIGMSPGALSTVMLPAFLTATKISEKDLTIVNVDPRSRYPALMEKRLDAIDAVVSSAVPLLESKGFKANAILYADYGINTLGHGLLTGTKFMEQKPDLVRRFVKASIKGWDFTCSHPEEAVDLVIRHLPNLKENRESFLRELSLLFPHMRTENTKGKPLGWQARSDWEETLGILKKYSRLEKDFPIDRFYTNGFVPE